MLTSRGSYSGRGGFDDRIALLSSDDEDSSERARPARSRRRHSRMSSTSSESPSRLPIKRLVLEGIVLLSLGLGVEVLFRLIGPPKRGFYCNDLSIGYVKTHNIVPTTALAIYVLLGTFLIMLVVELYRLFLHDPENHVSKLERGRAQGHRLGIRVGSFYGFFLLAFTITWILTTITKFSVGRLRPYFLAACKPDVEIYTAACFQKPYYIESVNCTNESELKVDEARLSFFSGHSAFAMVAAVYIVCYLQSRLATTLKSRIVTPLLQAAVLSSGLAIAYSRIVDHSHHPTDVGVGIVVGTLIALVSAKFIGRLFDSVPARLSQSSNSVQTHPDLLNV
uniref:AcidPPc domain-containing protein n=1 Tax=Panagrellus redivivus TaxID=6233 RepID=A0A7E4WC45_PANRE